MLGHILSFRSDATKLWLQLIDKDFSWQALADLAASQGAIFPLIWALNRRSLLLPVPTKVQESASEKHPTAVLQDAYRQYLERRDRRREQLRDIIRALNAVELAPLLLKGSRYLIAPTDSWCEARDMRDLDILVHRRDANKATQALEQIGYRFEGGFFPTDHHLPLLWLPGAPSAVELHIEAFPYSARKVLPTEDVWRHAIRHSTDDGAFFSLPDEWQLLVGLLHHQVSDHGHARRILAVKALWEFASLGQELPIAGWRAIADHMASRDQGDVLGSFVAQAAQLFGLDCPPNIVISRKARAHAASTYQRAFWPYPLRRGLFLADQLRFGFSRETMAIRYGADAPGPFGALGRHLVFLARYHRGRLLRRVTGRGDRFS